VTGRVRNQAGKAVFYCDGINLLPQSGDGASRQSHGSL